LENNRTARLANYSPSDRIVRELDQEIATAKAALNDAKLVPSREETTDVDTAWQQVHMSYVQNQIARKSLSERRAAVQARLNERTQQLARLQDLTVQFNNLQATADELKGNYQLYSEKRDQAQIEDAMDEQELLNVAIAQQPTLSHLPVRPRPFVNAVLGFVTALFLGLCAVYFVET
jgi:uncharacterized protein involved in exopolysaccharide biosynthesis